MSKVTNRPAGPALGKVRRRSHVPERADHASDMPELPVKFSATNRRGSLDSMGDELIEAIRTQVFEKGAVLLRGYRVDGAESLEHLLVRLFQQPLCDYEFRSTPRTTVEGKIMTSTEYPCEQVIPLHNENSYSSKWPNYIAFCCLQESPEGGATPIADSARVFNEIAQPVRERFIEKGVMYARNYGALDLHWSEVFGTRDKAELAEFCRTHNIEFEWSRGDSESLRTRNTCQAVIRHPSTRQLVWFNQAHLFHCSSLPTHILKSLIDFEGEEGLPRNAYFGDGSVIDDADIEEIRRAYDACKMASRWQRHDVLILDNMRFAHGREAYTGPRKVIVGLSGSSSQESTLGI